MGFLDETGGRHLVSKILPILKNKLDRNQGTENSGKIMGIDTEGNVVPVDKPTGGTGGGTTVSIVRWE